MTTLESYQPSPPVARQSSRANVDFNSFVFTFAGKVARYVFLIFTGAGLIAGAGITLEGAAAVMLVAGGLGLVGAGLAGAAAATSAHGAYSRHLAISSTTVYQEPKPEPAAVRPFVPSRNGQQHGMSIRVGRFKLPLALFESTNRDGRLTRDGAIRAGLSRELYRDWQSTLGELARLGIVDGDGKITPQGWELYRDYSPYPNGDGAPAGAYSTPARPGGRPHGDGVTA